MLLARLPRFLFLLLIASALAPAQQYDLLLRGGHVLDPGSGLDTMADVAVSGNRIAAVKPGIPPSEARKTVDVTGFYVIPGLIDLHTHVFGYEGVIQPDDTALPAGTTTIVDAGGSGWRTFDKFRSTVIAHAKTRVLALLNIVGAGMVGEPAESNTDDMDPRKTGETILRNHDVIVGVKTAHFMKPGWTAIDRAVEAGKIGKVPIMVDDKITTGSNRTTREELLDHLRPGDTHTHLYNDRQNELINRFTGKVQPYMFEARRRGVQLDMGHGGGSFLWPVASRAMAQGFPPDTISTDLHSHSIMIQQSDMPNCMSKLMLLGMSLQDAVLRSTANPAKWISRYPELGTLGAGRGADIAVLDLEGGVFAFKDAWGAKRLGNKRLENVLTVRDGKIVYEREPFERERASGDQQIYDLLLKNGHVIDPANHRNGTFDVGIADGKIVRVARNLRASHGRIVMDVSAYTVTPGLVETRAHLMDYETLRIGVTASSGASTKLDGDNMLAMLSRQLSEGAPLEQVVARGTTGAIGEGAAADVAVFEERSKRLRCVLTIRKGKVVWDSEGLSAPDWIQAGPYSNYK